MPAPGTLTRWHAPAGPGVRLDGGYDQGETVPGAFDSLVAKLVVTGQDRTQALERSRRALAEFVVEGMPTALPFHRAVVSDPAFTGIEEFGVHTSWIETDFDNRIPPYDGASGEPEAASHEERQAVTVEVGGRRIEVVLPASIASAGPAKDRRPKRERKKSTTAASGDAVASPMQGTIVKVTVEDGQQVAEGDVIVVLEAMKMEQPIKAHRTGTVSGLSATVGDSITNGAVVCEIKD
jgi:acetyl-CoA/propionyl-CoA carboxylase biotin carboxyl carrier protein